MTIKNRKFSAATRYVVETRVTIFDEAKSWTHFLVMFTLLSIGRGVARVVTFGSKLLPYA